MLKDRSAVSNFKIRVFFVFLFFVLLFFLVIARLFFLQVVRNQFFTNMASQQYDFQFFITPPRSQIFDRNNFPLTYNKKVKSAFVAPHEFREKEKTMQFLHKNYPKVYKQINDYPKRKFFWVERKLSEEKLSFLEKNKTEDINFIEENQRFYPIVSLAPLIGFTNIDNQGISGLELLYNGQLAGSAAMIKAEKDARAKKYYFTKMVEEDGLLGKDLHLTIDEKLQALANAELEEAINSIGAKEGAVVIMNPQNGEILAMVSYPAANPNEEIKSLEDTKNRIISDCFEFGSVVKAFLALAALEKGVVTPEEIIDCEGKSTYIDHFLVTNWKSVGKISFSEVLQHSSDVGTAKVAKRVGEDLYKYYRKLGLGSLTGLGFPGERSGFVNPPGKWSRSSILVLSFGYELNGTLLQIARAFSIIANEGYDVRPKIVLDEKDSKSVQAKGEKLFSDRAISQLKDILQTIGEKYKVSGFRVMGKTGTARLLDHGHYSKTKHIYTFAGIVEKGDYKRVVVTFIKEPKSASLWASETAAPLFQKIAEKMVLHERLG
ncbi:MAG: Peptidoglycan transglycosylase and transpeptidase FtsI [candidate division TM6 bacterium GW2011_GWE2_31_21]|nr:MAG: Peptidoglycan transglycosylase and transpeptidase FtsI [candidate division TM6 bacterium GW2011_GWE2_31_21]KKP54168.1 MAG: Peptidoglycan transglycosylase and transpeptidase FtsI [candidate division TM6 bacterium GW2011_GWF2_33_332]